MGVLYASVLLGAAAFVVPWVWENLIQVAIRLWATRNIPEPAGSLLLGHIPALVQSRYRSFRCFHAWSLKWQVYRVRFFSRPVVVVTDPDLYQPLLRPGPNKLPKFTAPYRMFEVFTNPERSNVLTSPENATWKAVRQAAVAALTMNNLRLCFPHITAVTQRLIQGLSAAGPTAVHDMDRVAAAITVDVIGLAAFNRDLQATCALLTHTANGTGPNTSTSTAQQVAVSCGTAVNAAAGGTTPAANSAASAGICGSVVFPRGREVLEVISHLVVAMQGRANPLNRWFPWRQAYRDLFYWGGRMSGLVRDLTSSMEEAPPPPHSLGAHLLKATYSTGQPLDRDQIMAEIGIMWGAGFETTAHTICWTLFLLATHPEAEARLCAELDQLGLLMTPDRPTPAALQWEHLSQLKYLSAVINESMRMYPVTSSGTIRVTHKPITLGGHHLPAGQPVLLPFWAIHRSPRLWAEPDCFRPERFLTADAAGPPPKTPTTPAVAEGSGAAAGGPGQHTASSGEGGGTASAAAGVGGQAADAAPDGLFDDDEYVDVAADIAAIRDQQGLQGDSASDKLRQPSVGESKVSGGAGSSSGDVKPASSSSSRSSTPVSGSVKSSLPPAPAASNSPKSRPTLELKDPTVDRRGFLPFSIGSRNCVGQALALVELKAVLALLLGTFRFNLHPSMGGFDGVDAAAKQTVTLRPEHGLLMTLAPRAHTHLGRE